jgi:heat-inducible transcriptional repressor
MIEHGFKDRTRQVLFAVVESYIENPDPVGSAFVTRKYEFNLSPATIRNIMSELEDMGYLEQPHTSAGRVPTDRGYRFYVNQIYKRRRRIHLEERILSNLKTRLLSIRNDINHLLLETARTLSSLSHCLGVAVPMKPTNTTLNRIQLYSYRGGYIAAVLFSNEGLITHKILNTSFTASQRDLNRISDYLNSQFSGRKVEEIQAALIREMSREKALCDVLISRAIAICREALNYPSGDIFVSGLTELFGLPDFSDTIKKIANAIEDKHMIIKLLEDLSSESGGMSILIGEENPVEELKGLSVIAAGYKHGDKPAGSVGIIGPTRMNYSKAILMVNATARFLTDAISEKRG